MPALSMTVLAPEGQSPLVTRTVPPTTSPRLPFVMLDQLLGTQLSVSVRAPVLLVELAFSWDQLPMLRKTLFLSVKFLDPSSW